MVLSFSWRGPGPAPRTMASQSIRGTCAPFFVGRAPPTEGERAPIAATLTTEPAGADKWAAQRGEGLVVLASG